MHDKMARVAQINIENAEAGENLNELNAQERTAERERSKALFNKRSDLAGLLQPLETADGALFKERKIEHDEIRDAILSVYTMVKEFTAQVKNIKPNPDYVQQVQSSMQQIEQSFSETKQREKVRFDALLREQYILETELIMLDRRITSWSEKKQNRDTSAKQQVGVGKVPRSGDSSSRSNMPPEVIEYERFIAKTGVRNGWDVHDHDDFVRMRTRFGGREEFIRTLAELMFTRTYDEIVEHETWYRELVRLEAARRNAIQRWKEQRNAVGGLKKRTDGSDDSAESDNESGKPNDEESRRLREAEKREREEQRQRVADWKRVKSQAQERERAEAERRAQRDAERRRAENDRRAHAIRERIVSHRESQREMDSARREAEERKKEAEAAQRRIEAEQNAERIAERNVRALEEKLARTARKRRELEERQRRLEELKRDVTVLNVVRDPQRLLEPTKIWKERLKSVGPSESAGRVFTPINKVQHLGTPGWRK